MLGRHIRSLVIGVLICAMSTPAVLAQQTPNVTMDVSETLFTVLAAMNACGYDAELTVSDPIREQVRADVAREMNSTEDAQSTVRAVCAFYRDHRQPDDTRELSQYVSLALNLAPPPVFTPTVKEADLPPDASYVLGMVPLLQRFYTGLNLHGIWLRHQKDYEGLLDCNHAAMTNMLLNTDIYLKMPVSSYEGRHMTVYVEPLAAPGQTNARTYGPNYFLFMAPEKGQINLEQVRHMYLHYVVDPQVMRRVRTLARMQPLLDTIKTAPLNESYKNDINMVIEESLIRAIEARMKPGKNKEAERIKEQTANDAAEEGYILAPYFEQQLSNFEKDPGGLQDALPNWLYYLDVERERKRANAIQFKTVASPELMPSRPKAELLEQAQKRFSAGDLDQAKELAQKVLDTKEGDPARATFLLAQISSLRGDMENARKYFEKTLELSREPRLIAWSHIYLGRIYDLKATQESERQAALEQYQAALDSGDNSPATKAAAQRGLRERYEPPVSRQQQENSKQQ